MREARANWDRKFGLLLIAAQRKLPDGVCDGTVG